MAQAITFSHVAKGLSEFETLTDADVLVHCSLSAFGRIHGGAQTIIEALVQRVGSDGTIVMPTLTNGRFDPSEWGNPPTPEEQWDDIRYSTPLFDPQKTPCDHTMSVVYELFRTWPGSLRSSHPHSSFAAWGKHKEGLLKNHRLEDRFGESSPLARLYDLDAKVLFLGSNFSTNTCFHLGEYRVLNPPKRDYVIVEEKSGKKELVTYTDVNTNSSLFERIGADFETSHDVLENAIGEAKCRLFSFCEAVDFAMHWLNAHEKH